MIFSKDLRYRLEYLVFRAAQAAATALPLEAVSSDFGSRLAAHRPPSLPAGAGAEQSGARLSRAFASRAQADRGRHVGESRPHIRQIVPSQGDRRPEARPLRAQGAAREIIRGGPCVVCGLHLGNWELVAYASKLMGASFTGVYQRLTNPLVDEDTRKLRAFLYDGGLLPKTPVTARALMKAAKSGGYPAFLADLRDDNGAAVPFFGMPALSTVFPALLARKAGLPLYAGAAFREPKVRFVIRAARVEVPHTARPAADAVAGTAALHAQFEAFIRAGAGTMDVGPPEVGLSKAKCLGRGSPRDRPNKRQ